MALPGRRCLGGRDEPLERVRAHGLQETEAAGSTRSSIHDDERLVDERGEAVENGLGATLTPTLSQRERRPVTFVTHRFRCFERPATGENRETVEDGSTLV